MVELVPKDLLAALLDLQRGGVRVNPEWGGHGSLAIDRVRARIKVRVERAHNGPWRRCITAPPAKEKQVTNQPIPTEAIIAAKEAMREVTPPPGVNKADWLAEHGDFALIAGAIAAAAPHIKAEAMDKAADDADGLGMVEVPVHSLRFRAECYRNIAANLYRSQK